jgi:hypothetical protein
MLREERDSLHSLLIEERNTSRTFISVPNLHSAEDDRMTTTPSSSLSSSTTPSLYGGPLPTTEIILKLEEFKKSISEDLREQLDDLLLYWSSRDMGNSNSSSRVM